MKANTIKKVLLISPYDNYLAYGLRLVSSYLKLHHIDTTILFLPTCTEMWQVFFSQKFASYNNEILQQIRDIGQDSDAIGISMMTMDRDRVVSLCGILMELGKPIILGGVHPTIDPDDAVTITGIINVGEGLDSFVEFCNNPSRRDIKNIWCRSEDGSVMRNGIRSAVDNIDSIPFPDYEYKNHFVLLNGQIVRVNKAIQARLIGLVYHQFASIGCPSSCTYCINSTYKKIGLSYSKFRFHSIDYIIREIKYALGVLSKIEYVNFSDDGFIVMNEKTIEEFSERYRKEICLPFSVMGIIPEYLTDRKMDMLVAAGLRRVRVGLQSANSDALQLYKRPVDISHYAKVNDMLQSYNSLVFPYYDVIMDNPFIDSEKDSLENIRFLQSLKGRFTLFLYSLRLYPGTDLYIKSLLLKIRLPEHYYKNSYLDYDNTLLNYILTIIRCTQNKFITSFFIKIYHKFGNIRIPKSLFFINMLIWIIRCGIEHVKKKDISGLPAVIVRCFFKKQRKP